MQKAEAQKLKTTMKDLQKQEEDFRKKEEEIAKRERVSLQHNNNILPKTRVQRCLFISFGVLH